MTFRPLLLACWAAIASTAFSASASTTAPAGAKKQHQLNLDNKPWTGDFDAMLERRMIRALVPYSRSLYYIDKGRERGLAADLLRDYERHINTKYAKELGKRPVTLYIIPTTRDELLPGLVKGMGDIAVANLTETKERQRFADFVAPRNRPPVHELLITGPKAESVSTPYDLSGKTVHLRPSSSYYQSMQDLNHLLRASGKAAGRIKPLPEALEDEDILEMLNAGLLDYAVIDDWKAHMWAQVLPNITVRKDIVLRSEGHTGWAIRKHSPQLVESLNDYYANQVVKINGIEGRLASYSKRIKQISNNTNDRELKRFEATIKLFEKYGSRYGFDPLMLAAQGYQESKLNQNAKSRAGAVGIMQLMPATGRALRVGNIHHIEPNIHGGAKYMSQLMTQYFPNAPLDEDNRPLFAFASYNAGPGNIAKMRTLAAQRGLDQNKWFNNVEIVVSQQIGIETTTYVRNIYKYYTAYKLVEEAQKAQDEAREKVGG